MATNHQHQAIPAMEHCFVAYSNITGIEPDYAVGNSHQNDEDHLQTGHDVAQYASESEYDDDLTSMSHQELAEYASDLMFSLSHRDLLNVIQYVRRHQEAEGGEKTHGLVDENLVELKQPATTTVNPPQQKPTDESSKLDGNDPPSIWESNFAKLNEYRLEHGDCNVGSGALRTWSSKQRDLYDRNKLPKDRLDRLTNIGFWTNVRLTHDPEVKKRGRSGAWDWRFNQLLEYKEKYGNVNVPEGYDEVSGLKAWLGTQKKCFHHGKLTEEKVKKLEEVGFSFEKKKNLPNDLVGLGPEQCWELRFSQLADYRNEHGNCNVPQKREEFKNLSSWVCTQRKARRAGRLREDRIDRLKQLGFEFDRKGQSNVR